MIKIVSILTIIASLFGSGATELPENSEPQILDGPGMEYVDRDYRNDYANCIPFGDIKGAPYLAVLYLGSGDAGKANKDIYINKLFESLGEEKIQNIKTYEYDGEHWFLVIPKYTDDVALYKNNNIEEFVSAGEGGDAFVIKCNCDITINVFDVVDMYYTLGVDEKGLLKGTEHNIWDTDDYTAWGEDNFVWDITHLVNR